MNKLVAYAAIALAVLAFTINAVLWRRSEAAFQRNEASLAKLKGRAEAVDRLVVQLRRELEATPVSSPASVISPQTAPPAGAAVDVTAPPATGTTPDRPRVPEGPVTSNALREVLITLDGCSLSTRTVRCGLTITNQSPAEKRFVLGIGGNGSHFESEEGGTCMFDDLGNDFLSAGGAVANRMQASCDHWSPCELEKTLSPAVKTPAWIRFDNVDAKASTLKLIRLKWSDGNAWVMMDFRNITLTK